MQDSDSHFDFYSPWPLFGINFSSQLNEIRQNTEALTPVVKYSAVYDKKFEDVRNSRIRGWEYGDLQKHNQFRTLLDIDGLWKLQINKGTEFYPVWVTALGFYPNFELDVTNFYFKQKIQFTNTEQFPIFTSGRLLFNSNNFYLKPNVDGNPEAFFDNKDGFITSITVDSSDTSFQTDRITFDQNDFQLDTGLDGQPFVRSIVPIFSSFDSPYFVQFQSFYPSFVWELKHRYNTRPINVDLYDKQLKRIEADEVVVFDPSITYFYFNVPTEGTAVVGSFPSESLRLFSFDASNLWIADHFFENLVGATAYDTNFKRIQPDELFVGDFNRALFYFVEPTAGIAAISNLSGSRSASFYPSLVWEFEHNLDQSPIIAHIYDDTFKRVYPEGVYVADPNTTFFYFLEETGGTALIEAGVFLNNKEGGSAASGVSDHGALTGLGDDDHPQYSLASGARAFTGTVAGVDPTLPAHLATKNYVDTTDIGTPPSSTLNGIVTWGDTTGDSLLSTPAIVSTSGILTAGFATNTFHSLPGNTTGSVSIGSGTAKATGTASVALGSNAQAIGNQSVAIGESTVNSLFGVGISGSTTTIDDIAVGGVAIGIFTQVSAFGGIALGTGAIVGIGHDGSVALGIGASTTAASQVRLGSAAASVSIPGVLQLTPRTTDPTGGQLVNGSVWIRSDLNQLRVRVNGLTKTVALV